MVVTIKILNNNKISNIMKNKYCILCVKNYLLKMMEDIATGILPSMNFKKVEDVRLFLVKHNSIFEVGYYNRKNNIFPI